MKRFALILAIAWASPALAQGPSSQEQYVQLQAQSIYQLLGQVDGLKAQLAAAQAALEKAKGEAPKAQPETATPSAQ